DLAVVDDPVAETEEGVLDDAADVRRRVEMPDLQLLAGQRDVDGLTGERLLELLAAEPVEALGDGLFEALAQRVQRHARLAVADLAQRQLELALAAEVLDTQGIELVQRRGRGDLGRR